MKVGGHIYRKQTPCFKHVLNLKIIKKYFLGQFFNTYPPDVYHYAVSVLTPKSPVVV